MTSHSEPDPFDGTEAYYATYRPGYSDAAIGHVAEYFGLDGRERALDLGCGAGQIADPLAGYVAEVIGMDPNAAMLDEARRRANDAGRENVRWVVGSDADLDDSVGRLDLTTMGRSFHWMDQERTLEVLYGLTVPGGGVAILGDVEWLTHGERDWQAAVYEVVAAYVDDPPERVPASELEYDEPWDELIADFGFVDVATRTVESERRWTVEEAVGYVLSLSFSSPAVLGDDRAALESDLRSSLASFGREVFVQDVEERVITGRKPGGDGSR